MSPEDYIKILLNPRSHTGRGYRRREDRPDDVDMDEFDAVQVDASSSAQSHNNVNDSTNVNMHVEPNTETGEDANATFYAKNETYDFKTQGHANRRSEMNKLHQSNEFAKWEEAAKKEWAVVHAKFYISLPKRQRRAPPPLQTQRQRRGGKGRSKEQEPLPEQAPVIDIKPAEKATLGTKFHAVGPSKPRMKSAVRMNRIKGLTDDDDWKGGPLFECKLYYRAEDIISGVAGQGDNDDLDMQDEMDDEPQDLASKLCQEGASLDEYKSEKINQIKQYHVENRALNPEEAEEMLKNCQNKIRMASNTLDIDELVKIYYDELVKREFDRNAGGAIATANV